MTLALLLLGACSEYGFLSAEPGPGPRPSGPDGSPTQDGSTADDDPSPSDPSPSDDTGGGGGGGDTGGGGGGGPDTGEPSDDNEDPYAEIEAEVCEETEG
ncbi:MAG: hypothetical protein FJ090_20580, partial [Deltaproteobacteria bacterium]|nr:hypothetical protein [Deltaproteobacteria bacterium]